MSDELTAEDEQAFREKCRAFLEEHATGIHLDGDDPRDEQTIAINKDFQGKLAEAGLAGLTYPVEYGGQGLTKAHDRIWREEYAKYPDMTGQLTISHGMCLPMVAEYGTDEQKARYLADNISAKTVWCQMFSEPGAGSDVASLQTKAELDGEEWTINGQKVWTTLAHVSDYGILIAPHRPRAGQARWHLDVHRAHEGPGGRGPGHPPDRRRHALQRGVLHRLSAFPRTTCSAPTTRVAPGHRDADCTSVVAIGTGSTSGITTPYSKRLIKHATKNGKIADPVVRDKIMKLYSEETAKSLVAMRTRAELKAGKTPGPGGSLGKLHGSNIMWAYRPLIQEVIGMESDAFMPGDDGESWGRMFLSTFMSSIAGGTDEIQRNIIGDRVLGLPREPSVDKGVPFKELKVGTQDT